MTAHPFHLSPTMKLINQDQKTLSLGSMSRRQWLSTTTALSVAAVSPNVAAAPILPTFWITDSNGQNTIGLGLYYIYDEMLGPLVDAFDTYISDEFKFLIFRELNPDGGYRWAGGRLRDFISRAMWAKAASDNFETYLKEGKVMTKPMTRETFASFAARVLSSYLLTALEFMIYLALVRLGVWDQPARYMASLMTSGLVTLSSTWITNALCKSLEVHEKEKGHNGNKLRRLKPTELDKEFGLFKHYLKKITATKKAGVAIWNVSFVYPKTPDYKLLAVTAADHQLYKGTFTYDSATFNDLRPSGRMGALASVSVVDNTYHKGTCKSNGFGQRCLTENKTSFVLNLITKTWLDDEFGKVIYTKPT